MHGERALLRGYGLYRRCASQVQLFRWIILRRHRDGLSARLGERPGQWTDVYHRRRCGRNVFHLQRMRRWGLRRPHSVGLFLEWMQTDRWRCHAMLLLHDLRRCIPVGRRDPELLGLQRVHRESVNASATSLVARCVACVRASVCAMASSLAAQEGPSAAPLRALAATLPRSGFVECVVQRESDLATEAFGYDIGSGTWYRLGYAVRQAYFGNGETLSAGAAASIGDPRSASVGKHEYYIEHFVMPFVWLKQITESPSCVTSFAGRGDGSRTLEFHARGGDPTGDLGSMPEFTYQLTIESSTHVVRVDRLDVKEVFVLTHCGDAAPGFPISVAMPDKWRLVSGRVSQPAAGVVPVTRALVDRVDREVMRLQGEARHAKASATSAVATLPPGTAEPGNGVRPAGWTLARPLLVAGAILFVIGGWLWWRYRA